ncbi:MAG: PhnD/SsuA/transferrin family substrate-binding protein [Deltaproteobacteria bacterium]|nr:PhnD/SsuA/transferrin family substrate-binding protein [Candidatus Anaeroferrophillacea bacterium]
MVVIFLLLSAGFLPPVQARETVRIGILAHCGEAQCLRDWQAVFDLLNQQLEDYRFILKPLDFDQVYRAVEGREMEFLLANPAYYVACESRYGAQRIATLKRSLDGGNGGRRTFFGAVIFCRSDHPTLETLPQVSGKRLMGVHENSFGGWLMARRELLAAGVDPLRDCPEVSFGENHNAVVSAVLKGRADVGTVRTGILERMAKEGEIALKALRIIAPRPPVADFSLLHSTRLYPEWPLAKLAHTSDLLAEKVLAVLLTQKEINTGEEHVGSYSWTIPQNYQKVHECLRDLKVAPYENFGRITLQAVLAAYWPAFTGLAFLLVAVFLFYTYVQKLKNDSRARRALQQSKDFLQNVIDANPDSVVVISADYDVLFANRAARKLAVGGHGFTDSETLKCYEYLYGLNHPCESRDGFQCPLRQEKNMLSVTMINKTMRDSNGELRSFEIAMAPLPCNGKFLGMVESFRDVSSRVRAEQARYRLERAVEQAGEAIVITDAEGVIQYVNPAFERITGYRREEALGQNPRLLQSGEHDRAFYENLWQTLLRGETWQGELVNRNKNGEIYYEDATISPIYDQERRLINFIAVKRDVTKLKRSQQALQESEEYHRGLFNDSPVPLFL